MKTSLGALILTAALAVGACSGDDEPAAGTSTPTEETGKGSEDARQTAGADEAVADEPVADDVEPADEAGTADSKADPVADDEPDLGGGDDCLVGHWEADNDFFLAQMEEITDVIDSVTGHVRYDFAPDGTYTAEYGEWTITATVDGHTVTIFRTGVDEGMYSVDGDSLTIEDTAVSSDMTVSGDGMSMEIDPDPTSYTNVPFTCDGSTATISTPDGAMTLNR